VCQEGQSVLAVKASRLLLLLLLFGPLTSQPEFRYRMSPRAADNHPMVYPLAYSSTLKMEVTCSSETSVDFQRTTRRYIPEERTLHNQL
jgi:hypothetical protein